MLGAVKEEETRVELEDVARAKRFEAVLKQAVARWEMDSDWERASELLLCFVCYASRQTDEFFASQVEQPAWTRRTSHDRQPRSEPARAGGLGFLATLRSLSHSDHQAITSRSLALAQRHRLGSSYIGLHASRHLYHLAHSQYTHYLIIVSS